MDEENLLKRKILDVANKSYKQGIYTYTGFLSLPEQSVFNSMKKELSFIESEMFGGNIGCERVIIKFGSLNSLGYEEGFPIDLLIVKPLTPKYSEELTHRDYLGALMNLGIDRSLIGDIVVKEKTAYIYCLKHITQFITDNLTQVKHTHVYLEISEEKLSEITPDFENIEIIAASPRIDAVVASLTKLSRNASLAYFTSKKVYLNGICCENNSYQLKTNDILVIRGLGKFIYLGNGAVTRKGRTYIQLKKYI